MALDVEATRRETYHKIYDFAAPDLSDFDVELFSYSGDDTPEWATNKQGESSSAPLNFEGESLTEEFPKGDFYLAFTWFV